MKHKEASLTCCQASGCSAFTKVCTHNKAPRPLQVNLMWQSVNISMQISNRSAGCSSTRSLNAKLLKWNTNVMFSYSSSLYSNYSLHDTFLHSNIIWTRHLSFWSIEVYVLQLLQLVQIQYLTFSFKIAVMWIFQIFPQISPGTCCCCWLVYLCNVEAKQLFVVCCHCV